MTIQHRGEQIISRPAVLVPTEWDWQLAFWVKQIGSPPVTAIIGIMLVGFLLSTATAWLWVLCYGLLTVVVPTLYVLVLYQRGAVSDFHLRIRSERVRPTLVMLAASIAILIFLDAGDGPALLLTLAGANVIQTGLFFAITLRWKISAHTASAAMLAVLAVWGLVRVAAIPIVLIVPLIAWSRVRLEDHTLAQVVVGAILGGLIFSGALLIYGG
jgi:membrane-associated phospholipid phosphatase